MRRRLALATAVLASAAVVTAGAPSPAMATGPGVVHCNHKPDYNITITSARYMSCSLAARVVRRYARVIGPEFRLGAYACHQTRGTAVAGEWRCVRGHRAFRFVFAD